MADVAGQVAEAWRAAGLSRAGLSRFLQAAQTATGLRGEVEVLLADDRTLRRLNREFRGKNKATDVLSFPASQEFAGEHAGDLAISLETAQRQAEEHGHSLRDEVRVLMLHGLLHLAGMDHEADGGEMAAREAALRVQLRLPNGLIARVTVGGGGGAGEKQVARYARNDKQKSKNNSAGVKRRKSSANSNDDGGRKRVAAR
jgi:probable rRNA maturation factor